MTRGRDGYTRELAQRICDQLERGRTLKNICQDDGMPAEGTVTGWARTDRDGFAARYRRVRNIGRPTEYTAEIAERICDELGTGRTLLDVCRDGGMPTASTVLLWANRNWHGFAEPYRRAREIGYHAMADELLEIADDSRNDFVMRRKASGDGEPVVDHEHIARSRLRVEARRWLLSKALPKIYGDRLDLKATHDAGDTLLDLLREIDGKTRGLPSADHPVGG